MKYKKQKYYKYQKQKYYKYKMHKYYKYTSTRTTNTKCKSITNTYKMQNVTQYEMTTNWDVALSLHFVIMMSTVTMTSSSSRRGWRWSVSNKEQNAVMPAIQGLHRGASRYSSLNFHSAKLPSCYQTISNCNAIAMVNIWQDFLQTHQRSVFDV